MCERERLPAASEGALVGSLAELLDVPASQLWARFDTEDAQFVVADEISEATADALSERAWEFPGVTVEEVPEVDTAWFVGVAPLDEPRYVVAVVIDGGGSGGKIAAPTARAILQYLMGEDIDTIRSGEETD